MILGQQILLLALVMACLGTASREEAAAAAVEITSIGEDESNVVHQSHHHHHHHPEDQWFRQADDDESPQKRRTPPTRLQQLGQILMRASPLVPPSRQDCFDSSSYDGTQDTSNGSPHPTMTTTTTTSPWKQFRNAIGTFVSSSGVVAIGTMTTTLPDCYYSSQQQHHQTVATVAMSAVQVERELGTRGTLQSHHDDQKQKQRERRRERIRRQRAKHRDATRHRSSTGDEAAAALDPEMIEGARLLSASFGLLANTIGLIADGVRVSGETAAGVMGSSVKLVGTAVKSFSGNLEMVSRRLEPMQRRDEDTTTTTTTSVANGGGRKPLTAQRLREQKQKRGTSRRMESPHGHEEGGEGEDSFQHENVFRNTRGVAAQSLRLIGNVIRGFGDTLVLAGSSTESIASSAVGIAEGSIRIFEDFAGSVSVAMTAAGRSNKPHPKVTATNVEQEHEQESSAGYNYNEPNEHGRDSYFSFGEYDYPTEFDSVADWVRRMEQRRAQQEKASLRRVLDGVSSQLWNFGVFLFADTRGVPSFAYDVLGVLILCFVTALWTLTSRRRENVHFARNVPRDVPMLAVEVDASESSQSGGDHRVDQLDHDCQEELQPLSRTRHPEAPGLDWKRWPLRLFRTLWSFVSAVLQCLFTRGTFLGCFYFLAWLYLSRASQLRSVVIQRHGETSGFRFAIDSLGRTTPTASESVVWLNSLLQQIWRISYDPSKEQDRRWAKGTRDYPEFVRRAIRDSMKLKPECLWDGGGSPLCLPYGGLEPYIVSRIGTYLLNVLEESKASRKNDVAYVSLYSFTMGSRPPLLRSVEVLGTRGDSKQLHFDIDADAFLEDLSLVLEVKLSSLDYALLPSTKVSIHAIDVKLPLRLSVSTTPEYPFISDLEFSLGTAPDCSVRITPLSHDSGLRGVDLGSLPVIREWIQDVLRETLSEYVSPKYIRLDFASWMNLGEQCAIPFTLPPTIPDLSQLRQKTRSPVTPNPRTSSSRVSSMSSVADSLPSHKSATNSLAIHGTAQPRIDDSAQTRPIIKPTTKLSRLGMDRWMSKQIQVVEGVQSASTNRLLEMLGRPVSLISPFLIAMAAGAFRDRIVDDSPRSEVLGSDDNLNITD